MSPSHTLYIPGQGWLYRLNPITKLVMTGGVWLLTFLAPGTWTPLLLFGLVLLPLAWLNGLGRPFLRRVGQIIAPLALFLVAIPGLFNPAGQTVLLTVGPLSLKLEGLAVAFLTISRLLSFLGASLLLGLTTPPATLMLALAQRGVPAWLTYILGATLQLIPHMQARAAAITAAQQARGLETTGSLPVRARALLPLLVPLVLGTLIDAEERAIALEARAFRANRPKTSLIDLPDPPAERVLRGLVIGLTLLGIGANWWR
jgi:energy-coupling factor transport system permease protein